MCGRYYIAEDDMTEEMARIIEEINRKKTPEGMKTSGEIFPSDIVPGVSGIISSGLKSSSGISFGRTA